MQVFDRQIFHMDARAGKANLMPQEIQLLLQDIAAMFFDLAGRRS